MLKTLRDAFKIKEVRDKLLYTLLMIIIVRIGCQLPVPGVDRGYFANWFAQQTSDAFNFLDAYSSGVPTLVAGYSVKSIGIARDLFGTEEGYVVDVRSLKSEDGLLMDFKILMADECSIRERIERDVSRYKEQLKEMKSLLISIME